MAVRPGEVVDTVAGNALGVRGDGDGTRPIDRLLQGWRGGVAVAALVAVHRHRIVSAMAADAEWGIKDMAQAAGRVIDVQVSGRGLLVPMAVEAANNALIGVGNHHGHRGAGGCRRIDIAGGVMAFDTTPCLMDGQDLREVADHMTVGAGL